MFGTMYDVLCLFQTKMIQNLNRCNVTNSCIHYTSLYSQLQLIFSHHCNEFIPKLTNLHHGRLQGKKSMILFIEAKKMDLCKTGCSKKLASRRIFLSTSLSTSNITSNRLGCGTVRFELKLRFTGYRLRFTVLAYGLKNTFASEVFKFLHQKSL